MKEFFTGTGYVLLFFLCCGGSAGLLRKFTSIGDEAFRKLLHCILLGSLVVWTFGFQTWYLAVASALILAVAMYPALALITKIPGFSAFVNERKSGEMKSSMLLVFFMYAIVATFCWGCMGERMLAMATIYAWGYGDAAGALIGKRFGKHKLTGSHIEGTKSVEGSAAMFVTSFITVLIILMIRGRMPWYGYPITAFATAAATATVELYSMKGRDTITCPLSAMSVLIPLTYAFGGMV